MTPTDGRVQFPRLAGDHGELCLEAGTHAVCGVSWAALATAFTIEGHRTAIDMGRCSAHLAAQDTVLLTHCHSDHTAGLIAWLSAHTRRHRHCPTRVIVPREKRDPLLAALEIWPDLDGVRRRIVLEEVVIGAGPGDEIELENGNATAFTVRHNTAALGWAVTPTGEQRPRFAFAGDGTVEPFRDDPSLLDAHTAVVDCSFIDPGTRVAARLGGHGHLQDWLELLPDLTCDRLVLAHLPPEATAQEISALLPDSLPGTAVVVPWVAGGGSRGRDEDRDHRQ